MDGLDGANLIVDGHDRDQGRIWTEKTCQGIHFNKATGIHWRIIHFESLCFEPSSRLLDGRMLNVRDNDMLAIRSFLKGDALKDPVVPFGPTRREVNFISFLAN